MMRGSRAKNFHWDDESTHKLIASYMVRHSLLKKKNESLWDTVFQDIFEGEKTDCTVLMCKWRFTRLRLRYNAVRSGNAEKSGDIAKFFDEMDEIFCQESSNKDRPKKELFKIMCRCCGQLTKDLTTFSLSMESSDEVNLMNWYLTFTGLRPDTVCQLYTKICGICRTKLIEARKFREQCLMAEQVLLKDAKSERSIKTEQAVDVKSDEKKGVRRKRSKRDTSTSSSTVECGHCKKTFRHKRLLASHMKNHSKDRRYKCHVCNKTYYNMSGLNLHLATHDASLMKFQCATCGEKFPSSTYLRYHMNRHTDTRPFVCKTCGQSYHRVHALNHHIKSKHENVKYSCDECPEVYCRDTRLKLHIVLAHKGAVLRCSVCDLESLNRSKFVKHLRGVHGIGFNQSVHVILANTNEKLVRRRKLDGKLIQTAKFSDDDKSEIEIC